MNNNISAKINDDVSETEKILEFAYQNHAKAIDHFDKLDTKAGVFSGLLGVVITIAASSSNFFFLPPPLDIKSNLSIYLYTTIRILYLFSVSSLVLSLNRFLRSLKIREVKSTAPISVVVKSFRKLENNSLRKPQLIKLLINNLKKTETEFVQKNRTKADEISKGINWLFIALHISVVCFVLFVIDKIISL